MLPVMGLRILADHFKTFLMNQGLMKISGLVLSISLVVFAISGYIFIVWLNMGAVGVGISMSIYQVASIILLYFLVYLPRVRNECKNFSTKVTT